MSAYFDSMTTRIQGAKSCEELTALNAEISASTEEMLAKMNEQMLILEPVALFDIGGGSSVAMFNCLKEIIKAFKTPYDKYTAQIDEVNAASDLVTSAYEAKKSELGCP
jgi:hypothetical protein